MSSLSGYCFPLFPSGSKDKKERKVFSVDVGDLDRSAAERVVTDMVRSFSSTGMSSVSGSSSAMVMNMDTFYAEEVFHEYRTSHKGEYDCSSEGFERFYQEKWPILKKIKTL